MKETKVVKGYKGFNPDFTCKGKQYKENTIFEEPEAAICEIGMHYCKNPLDVLDYYDLFDEKGNMNKFAEVEPLEKEKTNDGVKFCTRKLKIHSKLSLAEFIRASLNVTFSSIKKEVENATKNIKETNDNEMAGGNYAKMAGGKNSVIVCGHGSMAKAGKNSVIVLTESGISGNIVRFKAEQVDGVRIKEDTFYFLKDGEFKEYEG